MFSLFAFAGGCSRPRLGQHEALTFRLRNRISKFSSGINPELNGFIGAGQRRLGSVAVRHAAGEFRNFSDEHLVLIAPIDDDLVFVHHSSPSPPSPYLRITPRTCRTWYTYALLPSRCRLTSSRTPCFLKIWWLPRTRSSNPSERSMRHRSSKSMFAADSPCRIRSRSSSYLPTGSNLPQLQAARCSQLWTDNCGLWSAFLVEAGGVEPPSEEANG